MKMGEQHRCTVKLKGGRILQNTSVFLLFFLFCFVFSICEHFTFYSRAFSLSDVERPSDLGEAGSKGKAFAWRSEGVKFGLYRDEANFTKKHTCMQTSPQSWWGTHGMEEGELCPPSNTHSVGLHGKIKRGKKWHLTETTGKGNGVVKKNLKKKTKHKNSEAPQAGLIASNWQRWVRQLGFSNGSLCHSFFFPIFLSGCPLTAWICVSGGSHLNRKCLVHL